MTMVTVIAIAVSVHYIIITASSDGDHYLNHQHDDLYSPFLTSSLRWQWWWWQWWRHHHCRCPLCNCHDFSWLGERGNNLRVTINAINITLYIILTVLSSSMSSLIRWSRCAFSFCICAKALHLSGLLYLFWIVVFIVVAMFRFHRQSKIPAFRAGFLNFPLVFDIYVSVHLDV